MDLMGVLRYVMDHNQQVIGALIVIILATVGLLFARMVGQEKTVSTGGSASRGPASDLDLGAIESAFKRVLAAQGVSAPAAATATTAAGGVAAASSGSGEPSDLAERDSKIQQLAREIDRLTAELASRTDGPGFGGTSPVGAGTAVTAGAAAAGGGADSGAVAELQSKIAELEGKLTEYEIIEDDIADLSRFKEENAELRGELDALKKSMDSRGAAAPVAPAASAEPVVAAAVVDEPVLVPIEEPSPSLDAEADAILAQLEAESKTLPPAQAAAPAPAAAATSDEEQTLGEQVAALIAEDRAEKAPPPSPAVNTDASEVALKEFASSIEIQKAPVHVDSSSDLNEAVAAASLAGASILDDSLDTEKLLTEVSSLSETTDDEALSGELDTDKLLAEVGTMAGAEPATAAAPSASAAPAAAPSAPGAAPAASAPVASAPTQVPQPSSFAAPEAAAAEDDLLAEFKDTNDGGQG